MYLPKILVSISIFHYFEFGSMEFDGSKNKKFFVFFLNFPEFLNFS